MTTYDIGEVKENSGNPKDAANSRPNSSALGSSAESSKPALYGVSQFIVSRIRSTEIHLQWDSECAVDISAKV
eukprot:9245004-Pyramimonas_sp.AAC.1